MKIEYAELSLEALKDYKTKSPEKFKHKFGDLDLEAIDFLKDAEHPNGFDMAKHRRMIKKMLPKTPLLEDIGEDDEDAEGYTFPTTAKASTSVDGGETLEDNETK